ncbi:MAG: hypothetical protein NVS4B3_24950 [Gemmatimonadaceae bacterium]
MATLLPFAYSRVTPYLGYFAGALTVASFLPQVHRAWRTKATKDLSFAMFALLITSGLAWTAYGLLTGDRPVIATNVGMVTLTGAILVAKVRYK